MKPILNLIVLCIFSFQLHAQVAFTLSSSPGTGSGPTWVTAADINGDGKMDLICANGGNNTLSVLTNNGSGGFVLASSPGVGNNPNGVVAADVNGDGKVDLISANYYGNSLSVLTNNGSGGFVTAGTYSVGQYPRQVTTADVNGDGKVDLICANEGANTLSVLTNNGSGSFVLSSTLSVGSGSGFVTAADVNGDGKVDLICANHNDNTLSVLTNNGTGGFVLAATPVVGSYPLGVVAADVNGDGKVDLICANYHGNTLTVLTNNGSGGFVLSSTLSVGSGPFGIVAADVNGDGKVDLISANSGDNTLSVLTNNGSGGFMLAATLAVGSGPSSVAAADVNGDGKVDLISANINANALSVLTNGTAFPPESRPIITAQPVGQTNSFGTTAVFSVGVRAATGPQLFSYQWQLAGTNLPAATNNPLILPNLTPGQAGNYDVVITNSAGSITSSPAILDVPFIFIQVNGQLAAGTFTAVGPAAVTISGGYPGGFIFYTLDGSTPTVASTLYNGPFTLTNSAVLQMLNLSADFSQTYQTPPFTVQIIFGYTLQTAVIGDGTISTNPASTEYASNSVVTLTATPAPNWAFGYWTGNATGSLNPVNVTMNGRRSVQAVFIPTAYPLTASTPGGGSVTVNGLVIAPATYYSTGSVVTLAATASSGWSFLGWQGNASGTNNPLSVTMNQTNNILAIFGTVVGTNAVGGGNIVLSQPNPIPFGTVLTASAVPNPGNYFVIWSGAASGTNAPTTIAVTNANPTIDTLFSALPGGKYSLAVVVMGNGAVAISPQQNFYNSGSSVTLSASTTNAGASFYGWTGDGSGTNSPLVVVINTNKIVQANFSGLPAVNISPQNLIVFAGSNAVFSANAAGLPPLSYQWSFDGTNISGATNTLLTLTNVELSQAGNYAVLVTNAFGSVLSFNAVLVVNPLFHFVWSQIPSPRFVNTPFTVVVQAQNTTNGIATNFTSTVVLVSTNGIPIAPAVSANFIQGVWTGAVTVAQTATNLVLQATDNLGESGLANPINVVNLPLLTTVSSGGSLLILWPVNPSGFGLETTAGLSPANWVPVTTTPLQIGDQYVVPVQMSGTNGFYRLIFSGP